LPAIENEGNERVRRMCAQSAMPKIKKKTNREVTQNPKKRIKKEKDISKVNY